jgi:hypothetical protein
VQLRILKCLPDFDETGCPAYMLANQTVPFFYNSLTIIAKEQHLADTYECEDFVVTIMKVLKCLVKKSVFYSVFANTSQNLFENILLQFLKTNEEETHLF